MKYFSYKAFWQAQMVQKENNKINTFPRALLMKRIKYKKHSKLTNKAKLTLYEKHTKLFNENKI
jgi:hypothetical protein